MKKLIVAAAIVFLAACGGGGEFIQVQPQALAGPIAQCAGARRTSVVYVGQSAFPELTAITDACVYTTEGTTVAAVKSVVERAMLDSTRTLVFLIADDEGAATALAYMSANPGHVSIASFWSTPFVAPLPGLKNSLVSITLNDTDPAACAKQAAAMPQWVPATCEIWSTREFGPAARGNAITQLHLELAR